MKRLTKSQYDEVSALFRSQRHAFIGNDYSTILGLALTFADNMKQHDKEFNRDRFLTDCGFYLELNVGWK